MNIYLWAFVVSFFGWLTIILVATAWAVARPQPQRPDFDIVGFLAEHASQKHLGHNATYAIVDIIAVAPDVGKPQ